jgi:hypothetical protein
VVALLFVSAVRRTSNDSVFCNQHRAEPCFALHHACVSINTLFERNCLDYFERKNVMKRTNWIPGTAVVLQVIVMMAVGPRVVGITSEATAASENEGTRQQGRSVQLKRSLVRSFALYIKQCKTEGANAGVASATYIFRHRSVPRTWFGPRCSTQRSSPNVL